MNNEDQEALHRWLAALEARHMADLRLPELTRALRALSSTYVERRGETALRSSLDSSGKRAAFALFYAPLHFLVIDLIVRALKAEISPPRAIVDIGCGTGAAGAAWALASGGSPILGIDRHPWAVAEAKWTYRQLGLRGRSRQGDVTELPRVTEGSAVIAAYVMNELPAAVRADLEARLIHAALRGARVLIVEPISHRVSPWWTATAARLRALGGRADEWRFPVRLPPLLRRLDEASRLHHRELTARSLYCSARPG